MRAAMTSPMPEPIRGLYETLITEALVTSMTQLDEHLEATSPHVRG